MGGSPLSCASAPAGTAGAQPARRVRTEGQDRCAQRCGREQEREARANRAGEAAAPYPPNVAHPVPALGTVETSSRRGAMDSGTDRSA